MEKLYKKSELAFAILWIVIYCLLQSLANPLNEIVGIQYSVSALFCVLQSVVIFVFIKKNNLFERLGLCKSPLPASRFLFYIPLIILATRNFWSGVAINMKPLDTLCYLICMLAVGFVEEIIFRGFLFSAMAKDNVKSAIIVSSLTFGIGHLINLINGSGAELVDNLFQVTGAVAIGFLFVIIFHRGGSLWPPIIAHSFINMTSAFANENGLSFEMKIVFQAILILIAVAYALVLNKTLKKEG